MNEISMRFANRLTALRKQMLSESIHGFLVAMDDSYLNEYVPDSDRRIEFLSGFTGSAAFIIVLEDKALFFTDSRYSLQAENEVSHELFQLFDIVKNNPIEWLIENIKDEAVIGFDPHLHSAHQIETTRKKMESTSLTLRSVKHNLVDEIWSSRPTPLTEPIVAHDEKYAGQSSNSKRTELAEQLKQDKIDAAFLADPASIAWLLNIRGGDVPDTPLPLSRAILHKNGQVDWFVHKNKPANGLDIRLGSEITILDEDDCLPSLQKLSESKKRILIDPRHTPYVFLDAVLAAGGHVKKGMDICALPRACKNRTEIDGMQAAHRRDGAALVKLLAWIDEQIGETHFTEIDIVEKLEKLRAEGLLHKGQSFPTIAASGPNGAIVHYRPTNENKRQIDRDSFLLLDSGGQYLDGTTDVTRTIPTGKLTSEMKDRYTRVLKGHIALASVTFPEGTTGAELDILARQYLWQIGEDYGHGTGHGVGSYLSVHEGPQAISRYSKTPLKAGMVLSNEPGFYKAKHYGIRHENMQFVTEKLDISSDHQKMLGFTTLTLVPFDRRGIITEMLTDEEREWLNAYHTRIRNALLPQLNGPAKKWLTEMTEDI